MKIFQRKKQKSARGTNSHTWKNNQTNKETQTLRGTELRLQLYTPKTTGWPKSTLTLRQNHQKYERRKIQIHLHLQQGQRKRNYEKNSK